MSNTKRFLLVFMTAVLLFSAAAIFAYAGKEDMTNFKQRIILEEEYRPDGHRSEKWTPTVDQTQEALTAIEKYLNGLKFVEYDEHQALEYIKANFSDFAVQFVGFEYEGQKKIWCNFKHLSTFTDDEEREHWNERVLFTRDGGKDYWQIEYNTETGEVSKFYINGES